MGVEPLTVIVISIERRVRGILFLSLHKRSGI